MDIMRRVENDVIIHYINVCGTKQPNLPQSHKPPQIPHLLGSHYFQFTKATPPPLLDNEPFSCTTMVNHCQFSQLFLVFSTILLTQQIIYIYIYIFFFFPLYLSQQIMISLISVLFKIAVDIIFIVHKLQFISCEIYCYIFFFSFYYFPFCRRKKKTEDKGRVWSVPYLSVKKDRPYQVVMDKLSTSLQACPSHHFHHLPCSTNKRKDYHRQASKRTQEHERKLQMCTSNILFSQKRKRKKKIVWS